MKRKAITKQNTFKSSMAIDPNGRLIDATKDVTEQDQVRIKYHKLQSEQFDPLPEIEPKAAILSVVASFTIFALFCAFAYLILK